MVQVSMLINAKLKANQEVWSKLSAKRSVMSGGGGGVYFRMKGNKRFRLFCGFLSLPTDSLLSTDLDTPDSAAGSLLLFLTAAAAAAAADV